MGMAQQPMKIVAGKIVIAISGSTGDKIKLGGQLGQLSKGQTAPEFEH
jgi:peptidyl-prolyl cis-trans isomerase C